ncbi:DUF4239 domain-containing protein [Mycobacterium sp. 4858]|uniref:bestrophin-like domain n=1 Tax=Mycobacterium sp. 4858 TaxID=2057185 RepID=UPI000C833FC2|nr:DUF4239 domain-containing protein [Mycobacterium sp. 4858]
MGASGLPLWLVLVGVVTVAIAIAVGCISVANRTLRHVGKEHNPAMSPFIAVVALVYGALVGFTVVVSWQQFSSAEVIVANEASALTTMYRQTVAMQEPERTQIQRLLRTYATALENADPNKQASDGSSDNARTAITKMYRIIGNQPPNVASSHINAEFLSQLTVLASDRTQRIIDTKPRIPPLLWGGLVFGAVVLVALTGFLRLGSTFGHAMVSGAIAVLLGLLLCIIFSLDHPMSTEQKLTSAPFQHALEVFDAVDRAT